jgi:hypothetical protein
MHTPFRSDERGSVMVVVALTLAGLMGIIALGVDLGALFNARSEAQRAADAAALAGASAFLDFQDGQAVRAAQGRAMTFATSNSIRDEAIAPEEVSVWVDLDDATVRASIRREGLSTWFAQLFGVTEVDVGAEATAWAAEAGAAQCVKPFAVPDLWNETTDDTNGNRIWDENEQWRYDPSNGDRYDGFSGGGGSSSETGYGSDWRDSGVDSEGRRYDGDYGRRITIKATDPRAAFQPSFFLPWAMPADGGQPECGERPGGGRPGGGDGGGGGGGTGSGEGEAESGRGWQPFGWLKWSEKRGDLGVTPGNSGNGSGPGGQGGQGGQGGGGGEPGGGGGGTGLTRDDGSGRGAANYRRNICSCNRSVINLDTEYLIEPGNMVGPTFQGVSELIALDPDAYWDERSGEVVSEYGMNSPRVVTVSLFDPGEITGPGRQYIRFNNFARVFVEEQASRRDPVTGRFLYYVSGLGSDASGETTGSLVRVLQLIR